MSVTYILHVKLDTKWALTNIKCHETVPGIGITKLKHCEQKTVTVVLACGFVMPVHLAIKIFCLHLSSAIRNIATNVASMFTRTCRLFSIVVTSSRLS